MNRILLFVPIGYLWFRLIDNLSVEWTTNPQYSYGWVVPLLCVGLLWRRWLSRTEKGVSYPSGVGSQSSVIALFAIFAFLYLPTRLIEEATPEWRPIQWALGIEAIGLTLSAIALGKGRGWFRQAAFPICFFFVAIPWPTLIEIPVIQSLTRVNSAIVVELLGWIGIPAMQHGNLIEVSTGAVGVDEACSGIRSFQTSLMISLFFGEFYRMGLLRRLLLVPTGFIFAMAFNVCRMTFLTMVAARKGIGAIGHYHDPAGIAVTMVCTVGLWLLAVLVGKKAEVGGQRAKGGKQKLEMRDERSEVGGRSSESSDRFALVSQLSTLKNLGFVLVLWLVTVETGTELWYRGLDSHLVPSQKWSAHFPTDNPTFKSLAIDEKTKYLLRFDEGNQGTWIESDGSRWYGFYCAWWPGRVAGYLAKRHTPEICLPATGCQMISGPELTIMNINGVTLPVRSYVFETDNGRMYVFHCRWEAGVNKDAYATHESARFNIIRGIWAGRGKHGQKVFEIIASGCADSGDAKASLVHQLQRMIKVEGPGV